MTEGALAVLASRVDLFDALGEPQRLAIVIDLAISGRRRTVGEIAAGLPVDVSVVSRHLKVLRDAGAVEGERVGRRVLHWVDYGHLSSLLRDLADAIDACCPPGADVGPDRHGPREGPGRD